MSQQLDSARTSGRSLVLAVALVVVIFGSYLAILTPATVSIRPAHHRLTAPARHPIMMSPKDGRTGGSP